MPLVAFLRYGGWREYEVPVVPLEEFSAPYFIEEKPGPVDLSGVVRVAESEVDVPVTVSLKNQQHGYFSFLVRPGERRSVPLGEYAISVSRRAYGAGKYVKVEEPGIALDEAAREAVVQLDVSAPVRRQQFTFAVSSREGQPETPYTGQIDMLYGQSRVARFGVHGGRYVSAWVAIEQEVTWATRILRDGKPVVAEARTTASSTERQRVVLIPRD